MSIYNRKHRRVLSHSLHFDRHKGDWWPTRPPQRVSRSGSRLPIHVFNSVCLGLVPGQIDSPYLIIMPWITIPRDEYYTIPGSQLFVPPRKYVHSLILRAIRVPHRQMRTVPGKEGYPSSWVKLSECLYEKKDDSSPLSQELTTVLAHALIVLSIPSLPPTGPAKVVLWKKGTWPV